MKHSTWMKIAKAVADESKCISQRVGCVIVNNNRIVSSGYNGTPEKQPNCCDVNKHLVNGGKFQMWNNEEAKLKHHHWSVMHEIHAEMNALLYSSPKDRVGATLYSTLQPCYTCSLLIAGSGITHVVYENEYSKTPPEALAVLKNANVKVSKLSDLE